MLIMVDIECPLHGIHSDELVDNATHDPETGTYACPLGDDTHRCYRLDVSPGRPMGIIWSNAEHSNQLGMTFETNAQKRKFLAENPNVIEFSKGDATDRAIGDYSRGRADMLARKYGYRDEQHRREHVKYARERGYDPREARRRR